MTTLTAAEATGFFRSPPERFIETGGGAVAYRKIGTGPDVLFSHGWPVSGATFRQMLPFLAGQVTCHIIDHLGAGDSRFDRSTTISLDSHIQALRDVVDDLGLDDFAVVGHDSGGMIARFAFAGDHRVRGWGLIDTEQPPKPSWRFNSFIVVTKLPRFEKLLAKTLNMPRLRRSMWLAGDMFADKDLLDGEFAEFNLEPLRDDLDKQWASGEFGRNFDTKRFADLARCHEQMTAPTTLVWGEKNPFFPVKQTRAMMPAFAGEVSLEIIPRAKLFSHEEFPEATATALLKTIA